MTASQPGAVRPVPERQRGGRLRDPFGQQWMMSQHIEDVSAEGMARRAAAFFSQ